MQETRRIFDSATEPKQLVVFEGAGHVDLLAYDAEKYENQIVAYVNEVVGERIPVVELKSPGATD